MVNHKTPSSRLPLNLPVPSPQLRLARANRGGRLEGLCIGLGGGNRVGEVRERGGGRLRPSDFFTDLPTKQSAAAIRSRSMPSVMGAPPAHAIYIDVLGEVLIPACRLINGTTITQDDVEEVTYWHVELDSHDILLAEGLPAKSYFDCGNRRFFANAEATDLFAVPDARPEGPLAFCRPFHEAGPVVDLVRARLEDRAVALGWRKIEEAFAGLHVVADGCTARPDVQGLTARFVVPAEARDVRLVS